MHRAFPRGRRGGASLARVGTLWRPDRYRSVIIIEQRGAMPRKQRSVSIPSVRRPVPQTDRHTTCYNAHTTSQPSRLLRSIIIIKLIPVTSRTPRLCLLPQVDSFLDHTRTRPRGRVQTRLANSLLRVRVEQIPRDLCRRCRLWNLRTLLNETIDHFLMTLQFKQALLERGAGRGNSPISTLASI